MNERTMSRADLHVHSRFSDRPSEWFLRRIGAPESFVEPAEVYRICRGRGMDFVTLTDHNCIRGALEIAHLPGVFLSSEITAYFPEDRCKIHILVHGVTEAEFDEIQKVRENIHDLRALLLGGSILHSVAHPLFRINDRLSVAHVEKLILMFDTFEAVNGARDSRAGDLAAAIFRNLTPDAVARMAEAHGIEPAGETPWVKRLTGGSDDHSGLFAAEAHTITPPAATAADYLAHLSAGRHEPGGRAGNSLRLARSLYQIAYDYYRTRFGRFGGGSSVIGAMLAKLAGIAPAEPEPSRFKRAAARTIRNARRRRLPPAERRFMDEISGWIERSGAPQDPGAPAERSAFLVTAKIAQSLTYSFASRFADRFREGRVLEAIEAAASLGPVALGIAPYLTAFGAQHKDEPLLRELAGRFEGVADRARRSGRKAWFTDTLTDVNGVARTVRTVSAIAAREGRDLTVIASQADAPRTDFPLKNFEPVGRFSVREYPQQSLSFPPFLEILEFIESGRFDELVISTPGPVGLCGLAAARLFGLRVREIYHTDFPDYVRLWTDDDQMKDLAWKYMSWFYGGMDRVYAPSRFTLEHLAANGFDRDRLAVMPRGIDLDRFGPSRRNPEFWLPYGINGGFKFLYVGRISKEKNLDTLIDAFTALERRRDDDLILVGDGPELDALRSRCSAHPRIAFTGALHGERLAEAYASADAFVFPSLTDTFGNAVLEAHASGLPAVVGARGGPPEIVASHASGLVVEREDAAAWSEALDRLRRDPELYGRLKTGALARARDCDWRNALTILD